MSDLKNTVSDAIEIISKAKKKGITLFLEDDKLRVKIAKNSIADPEIMELLKKHKEGIHEILSNNLEMGNFQSPIFQRPSDYSGNIPLSFSQERLWFIDQMEGSTQYHIPSALRLIGKLNLSALEFAIKSLVNRHEVLRTVIEKEDGSPYQRVISGDHWTWSLEEDTEKVYLQDPIALQSRIQELLNAPFDLSKDYMLRASLIILDNEEYLLVVVMHHIVSDGWSLPIVVHEIVELYDAFVEKRESHLLQLPIQYADFAIWQRNHLSGKVLEKKMNYWKNELNEITPLNIPTDFPRPYMHSTRGGIVSFVLDKELSARLQLFSREQNTTLFMTLLAAFKVLLFRYSGKNEICVGTPIAGRQNKEVEGLIGFFVNSLALRTMVNPEDSVIQFLQAVKTNTLTAYDHQEVPFEKIVEAVVKERDMSMTPLFQVVFALQNNEQAVVSEGSLGGVKMIFEDFDQISSKYDLNFSLEESDGAIVGSMEYCTDLFNSSTIEQLLSHYQELLRSFV
ncbi:MAG: condensation domain-containing protein, partial [Fluviicola sp.]|nr:condensation domain-containing protein [Fluviicola sp.]